MNCGVAVCEMIFETSLIPAFSPRRRRNCSRVFGNVCGGIGRTMAGWKRSVTGEVLSSGRGFR
jgi:hypothetical protein